MSTYLPTYSRRCVCAVHVQLLARAHMHTPPAFDSTTTAATTETHQLLVVSRGAERTPHLYARAPRDDAIQFITARRTHRIVATRSLVAHCCLHSEHSEIQTTGLQHSSFLVHIAYRQSCVVFRAINTVARLRSDTHYFLCGVVLLSRFLRRVQITISLHTEHVILRQNPPSTKPPPPPTRATNERISKCLHTRFACRPPSRRKNCPATRR